MKNYFLILSIILLNSCNLTNKQVEVKEKKEFIWEAANVYFLLTDRFNNGDKTNDINFNRKKDAAILRGFKGGDIKGITQKINEGYFTDLGINAIWMTPIVEQIHASTDEGTGKSYGFHGYWTKDWTAVDPNFGTKADVKEMIDAAHKNGIRILLDAVINHTGPVTEEDPVWPSDWVRTGPECNYSNYKNTVTCTLVKNLPDIKTESNEAVDLPPQLVEKWKKEGRYEQEIKELDAFFTRTGYPRAPRFYIIKWLTDYITEFGIDGYRADTVKHTEESVWQEFRKECDYAFAEYKKNNPEKVLDENKFYLVGEVYNYGISSGTSFDLGDKKVNYFDNAFNSLINFEVKWNAKQMTKNDVFERYDSILHNGLKEYGIFNYMSSHDDGMPFDKERAMPFKTATMLLLIPGTSQVYYGDETARELVVKGAIGDANLRSLMNWEKLNTDVLTQRIHKHWQKLGQFRANHPAVGAGKHTLISHDNGLVFSRIYKKDKVLIGIDIASTKRNTNVLSVFSEGDLLRDAYSGKEYVVRNGSVEVELASGVFLLEKI